MDNQILRIKENDPNLIFINMDGGGSPIYKYKGNYFTGIVEDYLDCILNYEAEYENGYLEGWVRFYHPNGDLETVKNYITIWSSPEHIKDSTKMAI